MDTLVLSAAFEPMAQVSWERAMTLWVAGRVEVVEEYDDRVVRTVRVEFQMPSVVRHFTALRSRKQGVKFSRGNVFLRDKGRCQYCGKRTPRHEATYDHVIPRSKGGRTTWENIVIACVPCNRHKADRTPKQARMRLRQRPVKPSWMPAAMAITYRKGMPESWKQYLSDLSYWHGELDNDNA